jgi:hypothetical protein
VAISFQPIPEAASAEHWRREVRPLVLERLGLIYGATPDISVTASVRPLGAFEVAAGGGTCTQSAVTLRHHGREWTFSVAAFSPSQPTRGVFLGLNFRGNHALVADSRMVINETGNDGVAPLHYENAEFLPPAPRGSLAQRWPIDLILGQGYGLVTMCYLQCGPDSRGVFATGPHALLDLDPSMEGRPWGAIGIWAWTLSRILDLLARNELPGIASAPTFAIGHSRLGKTALWAAAQDERFAGAISNNSGAMGAALSRDVGETPRLLTEVRPYWFAPGFVEMATQGLPLPADQWHLLALLAPRLLLVGSASDDAPADPEGELLSMKAALPVWRLLAPDIGSDAAPSSPSHHLRPGGHDLTTEDWVHYLAGVSAFLAR